MIDKTQAALKLALVALNELIPDVHDWYGAKVHRANTAITAIREALADHIPDATKMMEQPAQPYKGIADHIHQATNGAARIDPVTGDFGIGTPPEQPAQQQEPVAWDNCRSEKQCRSWCGNSACASHWNDTSPQPAQQDPVAEYIGECNDGSLVQLYDNVKKGAKFYTSPQSKPWVGLTDDECDAIYNALDEWANDVDSYDFGLPRVAGGGVVAGREVIRRAIEAANGITREQK